MLDPMANVYEPADLEQVELESSIDAPVRAEPAPDA
jgi:hypothetical protein